MLKRQEVESENHSRMLRQKNIELERKLKEKENPETTIALQTKMQEIERKLKETKQQKRDAFLGATSDAGRTRGVQGKNESDMDSCILASSNVVNRPAHIQKKGAESVFGTMGKMISRAGEKENKVTRMTMKMPFTNFKRGSKHNPLPKPMRLVKTTKPSVAFAESYAKGTGTSSNRPSGDNVQGQRDKENKKKIWSWR